MTKEQLETNMAALKLLQSETNDKVRSYQQQIAELEKQIDRKSTRLNSSHLVNSYAVFCSTKENRKQNIPYSKTRVSNTTR